MRIKQIEKLCKRDKTIVLFDDTRGEHPAQWIGDGKAAYPVEGLPELDRDAIFTIFSVPDNKQDKWAYHRLNTLPDILCFEDKMEGEAEAKEIGELQLVRNGRTLKAVRTSRGIIFYDTIYMEPISDLFNLSIFERSTKEGASYIAVKTGFLLRALIMPYDIIKDDFVDELTSLAEEAVRTLSRKKAAQCRIAIDWETGEIIGDDL